MRKFNDSLPMTLLRTRETVMRYFRPKLRAWALTEQQWRVLRCLRDNSQGLNAKTLAQETIILKPSLSRIIKTLEARKLIKRDTIKQDQRRIVLKLTPNGQKVIDKHAPDSEKAYNQIEKKLGKEKLQTLMRLLKETENILG